MSGGKQMKSSVSFTLPISCQICLGKVKEPVTCSNQHVFCSPCMNIWLDRNSQCPTCRVDITPQSPIKPVLGGELSTSINTLVSRSTSRELRRVRYELVRKEYEDEMFELDKIIEEQRKETTELKEKLALGSKYFVCGEAATSSTSENLSCSQCGSLKDTNSMLDLTKRLQEATRTFGKTKKELAEVKKLSEMLQQQNHNFKIENQRIREEMSTRSPLKYGRLTVATLQSRLDASEKQVAQLQKALERNDQYTEQLESELRTLRSLVDSQHADESTDLLASAEVLQNERACQVLTWVPKSLNSAEDLIKQEYDATVTPSTKFQNLHILTPTTNTGSSVPIEVDDNSMPSSTDHGLNIDYLVDEFVTSASSPPNDTRLSFSRRLTFDENILQDENTVSSSYEFENICDLGLDLTMNALDTPADSLDDTLMFNNTACENAFNAVDGATLKRSSSDRTAYYAASPSAALKTTINAGGACITMSELNEEERSKFVRPSSAPSRTFLLSGSKFSALRPIGPIPDNSANDGFQPVKCISPMHMLRSPSQETEARQIRAEASSSQSWSKPAEEQRAKDILSRVNILKRKSSHVKVQAQAPSMATPPTEGRRKQKFSYKRSGEMLFQSPVKSPKL